jgi:hypothetical protein
MLSHVYWIGGSPCSGKSSIAEQLVERYDMLSYPCDAHFDAHRARATAESQPNLSSLNGMSWDDIWMRPAHELLEHEIAIYREEFEMILNDLRALPDDRPIIAEGAALLPELVLAHLGRPQQAVWVVPTPEFQWQYYSQRPWIQDILKQCSFPEQAFKNWMGRDTAFGQHVVRQARQVGLSTIIVDGTHSIEAHVEHTAQYFGLAE